MSGQLDPIELMKTINELEYKINALSTITKGWSPIPLTTPLTSTSYDGDDTVAVGVYTIDTSAVFGAPAGIKMAAIYFRAAWASASNTSLMNIRTTGTDAATIIAGVRAQTTFSQDGFCNVPCDANGDFVLTVGGANALNVILRIATYWI